MAAGLCLSAVVAAGVYSHPAHAAGVGYGPHYVTLTVNITPRKSIYSMGVWGRVHSELGPCSQGSCPFRIVPGKTYHFTEWSTNRKKHPFQYWILPNGKHSTAGKVTYKVTGNAALTAKYK